MRSDGRLGGVPQYHEDWTIGRPALLAPVEGNARIGTTTIDLGLGEPPDERPSVGIRELARNVSGVVADVVRNGRPVVVTKHGAPFAAIVPLQRGEETVLAQAAQHLEEMAAGDLRAGRTRSSAEVFAELARLAGALAQATSDEED
jgi:prevent-host-death family protein